EARRRRGLVLAQTPARRTEAFLPFSKDGWCVMHGNIALAFRGLGLGGLIVSVIFGCMSHSDAASINVNWAAPTTNADGTPLRDLGGYRLYVDTKSPTCPGSSFHAVASSTSAPAAGQQMSSRLMGLTANATYFARVTAVDQSGNESTCSGTASAAARPDLGVTPSTTVSFGSVATGSAVDPPSPLSTPA